jgi:hypothetical protein
VRYNLHTENFTAGATIPPYRIIKFGTTDGNITVAAAATDFLIGVSNNLGALTAGRRADCVVLGVAEIEFGGTITRGALLTSDSSGRAVVAVAGNRIIGIAWNSGVINDIGFVLLAQN